MTEPAAATVVIVGEGIRVLETDRHPAGVLRGGAYDPRNNTLYLGTAGHPQGTSQAGGDPNDPDLAGISVFFRSDGRVYWANDSASIPRALTQDEAKTVQAGLEAAFRAPVVQLQRIGDVPKVEGSR